MAFLGAGVSAPLYPMWSELIAEFDGGAARMLDVPPFTPAEGAALLAAVGGGWLSEPERRELVADVDGHALAIAALGGALADRPPTEDLAGLRAELTAAVGTNARVARVLRFYADRLADADRYLVAAVSLFAHPVSPAAVLTVAGHDAFDGHLDGWNPRRVEGAARDRLAGLLSWHPDGSLSAHPLVCHCRAAGDAENLSIDLRNWADCLGYLGEVEPALRVAAEALTHVPAGDRVEICNATTWLGWISLVAGDIRAAEGHFREADRINLADDPDDDHLYSHYGVKWGELLARTGRPLPCRRLTDSNRAVCVRYGWNADVARCDRLLGRLDLAAGYPAGAAQRVASAATTFRDGDYLVDLAQTLPVLADCARAIGDLDAADRHLHEALDIAGPRRLRPAQAAALTFRASTYADRAAAGNQDHFLQRGRDDADAAHLIATRHRLAWEELDALDAHARLDQVEGVDRGWATRSSALRARLIPDDLDPDPLATVELLVAEDKARDAANGTDGAQR